MNFSEMDTCQFCFSFGNTSVLCMEAETCGIQNCYLPFKHKHNICNSCMTKYNKDKNNGINLNTKNNNDNKKSKKNKSSQK